MTPAQKLRLEELLELRTKVEAKGQYLTITKQAELKRLIKLNHNNSVDRFNSFDYDSDQ